MNTIELLKFNLQEKQFPYFDEADLLTLLEKNNDDVNAASYEGCLLKSQNDAIKLGSLSANSNEDYWVRLAEKYKPVQKFSYNTSMKRSDGR